MAATFGRIRERVPGGLAEAVSASGDVSACRATLQRVDILMGGRVVVDILFPRAYDLDAPSLAVRGLTAVAVILESPAAYLRAASCLPFVVRRYEPTKSSHAQGY